jgi:hypothetical protein
LRTPPTCRPRCVAAHPAYRWTCGIMAWFS